MQSDSSTPSPNPWHYKPWWCQPWSIALTGCTAIGGSWFLFHRLWLTLLISLPILVWMGFFLILWPQLMIQSGLLEEKTHHSNESNPVP